MKLLNGAELAAYIKERQAKQVRGLRQADGIAPKLAIVQTIDDPVIDMYVRMKRRYGEDILVDVVVHKVDDTSLSDTIAQLNSDATVHGIIIQLPLADASRTQQAVDSVAPAKDVDGLGSTAMFTPATAMAIDWLVAGFGITLSDKKIGIVGNGRLVGAPLAKLWRDAGHKVAVFDSSTVDLTGELKQCDVVVSAAGAPGLVTSQSLRPGAVVIDAATSAEHGKIVGDIADDVRQRDDLTITPEKGGVGPLTVCALFDNVIRSARRVAEANKAQS